MGKAQLSKRGEIFCPILQNDIEPGLNCFKFDKSVCPLFGSLKDNELICNHPDFENCNPESDINL